MKFTALSGALSLVCATSLLSPTQAESRPMLTLSDQAELAKPSVVRVENGCYGIVRSTQTKKVYTAIAGGFGSGYFVTANGHLVTNAHVVQESQNLRDCKVALTQSVVRQMIQANDIDATAIAANLEVKVPQLLETLQYVEGPSPLQTVVMGNGDRLPYDIVRTTPREDIALIKVNVQNAPTLPLGNSDQARPVDAILTIGFPAIVDGQSNVGGDGIMVDPRSNREPTISGGQISARKISNTGSPLLQISAPATQGSSGGPVLNDRGQVIGMVTFGPEESGFAFAVASNTVLKVMQQAGVKPTGSPTNQVYADAIALFRGGQYNRALPKLHQVQTLFPYHGEVHELIQQSASHLSN
jgi:S1-C subfamily serine protease